MHLSASLHTIHTLTQSTSLNQHCMASPIPEVKSSKLSASQSLHLNLRSNFTANAFPAYFSSREWIPRRVTRNDSINRYGTVSAICFRRIENNSSRLKRFARFLQWNSHSLMSLDKCSRCSQRPDTGRTVKCRIVEQNNYYAFFCLYRLLILFSVYFYRVEQTIATLD